MQYFKRMVNSIRTKGILDLTDGDYNPNHLKDPRPATFVEWNLIEKCQPYVLIGLDDEAMNTISENEKYSLDSAPFPVFSIERLEGPFARGNMGPQIEAAILCCMAIEIAPTKFSFLTLQSYRPTQESIDHMNKIGAGHLLKNETQEVVFKNNQNNFIGQCLEWMNREKQGALDIKTKIKVGSGKLKRHHTIRRVIYVAPRKMVKEESPRIPRDIDWSHRWEVRGHWRRTEKLGKNREGTIVWRALPGLLTTKKARIPAFGQENQDSRKYPKTLIFRKCP